MQVTSILKITDVLSYITDLHISLIIIDLQCNVGGVAADLLYTTIWEMIAGLHFVQDVIIY